VRPDPPQFMINGKVAARGGFPAEVGGHRTSHHAPPHLRLVEQRGGARDRRHQSFGGVLIECEASSTAFRQADRCRIEDSVGEPADPADERQSAVAQGI